MTKRLIPRLGLSKLNALAFAQFVAYIITALTGNAAFPAPSPTLVALQAKLTELKNAITDVSARVAGAIELRNQIRNELVIMLTELANYCVVAAAGDAAVFKTSGFELRRTPQPAPDPLDPVKNTRLVLTGDETELRLLFDPVRYAKSYEIYMSLDDDQHFTFYSTTSGQRFLLRNLLPGKRYFVKVKPVGPKGIKGGFGEIASRIAA